MIIYDVSEDKTEEYVLELIYVQNLSGQLTRQQYEEHLKVRFREGPKGRKSVHCVVEVDPALRRTMIQQEKLM